jgi:Helix-turn-helix
VERHLTQETLAERAQVHPHYISDIERGTRNVAVATCKWYGQQRRQKNAQSRGNRNEKRELGPVSSYRKDDGGGRGKTSADGQVVALIDPTPPREVGRRSAKGGKNQIGQAELLLPREGFVVYRCADAGACNNYPQEQGSSKGCGRVAEACDVETVETRELIPRQTAHGHARHKTWGDPAKLPNGFPSGFPPLTTSA